MTFDDALGMSVDDDDDAASCRALELVNDDVGDATADDDAVNVDEEFAASAVKRGNKKQQKKYIIYFY